MMGAVYREDFPVQQSGEGACLRPGLVDPVPLPGGHMPLRRGQVLGQAAAEKHVQDLMSPADAEDGFSRPEIGFDETEFLSVPFRVQAEAGLVFPAVKSGIHVLAPGENEAGAAFGLRLGQIGGQGDAPIGLHRLRVVPNQVGAQGDLELRLHLRLRSPPRRKALPPPAWPRSPGEG